MILRTRPPLETPLPDNECRAGEPPGCAWHYLPSAAVLVNALHAGDPLDQHRGEAVSKTLQRDSGHGWGSLVNGGF